MSRAFSDLAFTPTVRDWQARQGSRAAYAKFDAPEAAPNDRLGEAEAAFVEARDHFFMATVGETGWPYVQHRGGPVGFLRVLDPQTLGFADYRGNRQYISAGNLQGNDRVSLFLLDSVQRRRLKLLGRARAVGPDEPALLAQLVVPSTRAVVERGWVIRVEAWDWNCPQHITPRYTAEEVAALVDAEVARRVAEALSAAPGPRAAG